MVQGETLKLVADDASITMISLSLCSTLLCCGDSLHRAALLSTWSDILQFLQMSVFHKLRCLSNAFQMPFQGTC